MEFYNKKYPKKQFDRFPALCKNRKDSVLKTIAIKVILILASLLYFQSTLAIPEIPTPVKIAIDPGRVKERTIPKRKPIETTPPKEITKEALKKVAESISKPKKDAIKFKLSGIVMLGVTAYKKNELTQYYQPYINKDISLSDLHDIANIITARYRKDGYVISRAIVPPQEITAGKVTIQVIEGYIAKIYIEGKTKKVHKLIKQYGEKITQMKPLQSKKLERYTLLINDIPGLTARTILSPSPSEIGAADLTFIIEQKSMTGDIYYDNRGSKYLGPKQTIVSASARDAISAADELTFQTIFTPHHSELRYIRADYSWPTGISGLRISIDGGFTETRPGFILKPFDIVGRSKNVRVGAEYPLLRTRTKSLWLYGQLDWLDTYTKVISFTLFEDHIRSIRAGISYIFNDPWKGSNIIDVEFSKGLGILGASPHDPITPLSRFNGLSDYKKIIMNFTRYQSIGQRWVLLSSIASQYSFHNALLSSEEFGFGGQQFARAYDPSELTGDSGVVGKLELRFNTFPDWRFLQQIQYYTFYDIGAVWNVGADFTQQDKDSASNLGIGLRATINSYFYGNLEITKPLTRDVYTKIASGENGRGWRFYFGLGVSL